MERASAIEFSLQSFAPVLKGSHVKWFTDNQAVARIVEVSSMKLVLHRMARRIFDICAQSGICLDIQWIPRTFNEQADYISRLIDGDDLSGYSMHIGNQSLTHGRNLNSLLGSKHFKGQANALRMEFLD